MSDKGVAPLADETFAAGEGNQLPGNRNAHLLPGFVLESLEKLTLEMFEKLDN